MNPLDRLDSPMSPCRRTSARARMWTAENRPLYDRDKLRYPSDLTDAEWQHIGPLLPPAKRGGGKRTVDMREVVNGLMYVLSTGCQWRYIPNGVDQCEALCLEDRRVDGGFAV